jgi:signal transduction histidine kinase
VVSEGVEYVHGVRRLWLLVRTHGLDALIVLMTIGAVFELALKRGTSQAAQVTLWFAVPAIVIMVLPLFVRRRFPFAAPATYWLLALGLSFVAGRLIPYLTTVMVLGMAASFLLGNLRDASRAWGGLGIVIGGAAIIVYNKPAHSTSELIFIPLLFGIGWLGGYALRERSEQAEAADVRATQAERERDAAARIAVAEERARIARELHDIVAHAVSVMVLQVGAVRHRLPDALTEDRKALQGVEQVGRTALTEMRRLLAAMRPDGDAAELTPQPGLESLKSLAEEIGRAGLPVWLHVDGQPSPLPRAIDLSAYRIAQEGLTNALKHARASQAEVMVDYAPGQLRIEVRDDGVGTGSSDGLGHGLVGIRERVKIYGGEMTAGPAPSGGFLLSARLPIREDTP